MQCTFDFQMQIEPLTITVFIGKHYSGYSPYLCNLCIDRLIHAKMSKNKNLSIEPFYPKVANSKGRKPNKICSDKGSEFYNSFFKKLFKRQRY